jgi:hypothetical protein
MAGFRNSGVTASATATDFNLKAAEMTRSFGAEEVRRVIN